MTEIRYCVTVDYKVIEVVVSEIWIYNGVREVLHKMSFSDSNSFSLVWKWCSFHENKYGRHEETALLVSLGYACGFMLGC